MTSPPHQNVEQPPRLGRRDGDAPLARLGPERAKAHTVQCARARAALELGHILSSAPETAPGYGFGSDLVEGELSGRAWKDDGGEASARADACGAPTR
jgi:hypothetical protein